jgi:hypothetical protein
MKKEELQRLAQKIQLEIKEEEIPNYLETFKYLEKLLANLPKAKMEKIRFRDSVGYLTLTDLKNAEKKFLNQRVKRRTLQNNAKTASDGFILFKKDKK